MGKRRKTPKDTPDTAPVGPPGLSLRGRLDRKFDDVWDQASTFRSRWRALGEYLEPTRPVFSADEWNKGNRANDKIIDSTAPQAADIAKTGLVQGMASPSRPWFTVDTPTRLGARSRHARKWLEGFRDAVLDAMDRSNFYTSLGVLLADELKFATGAMAIFEDDKKVIRCQTFPIGSYGIAQDPKGRVDTFGRRLTMTARQMVEKYPEDALSMRVLDAMRQGRPETPFTVRHLICPNEGYKRGMLGAAGHRWAEYYWEDEGVSAGRSAHAPSHSGNLGDPTEGKFLEIGGYSEFPIIVGRWDRNDDDVWGTSCPGIVSLGDNMMLQQMMKKYLNALEKALNPPLLVDPALDNKVVSLLAGARTSGSTAQSGQSVRPIHELTWPFREADAAMEQVRLRIRRAFMEPLFLMLIGDSRATPPTAEEIRAREREKAAVLGPIQERHSDDVFEPAIDRISAIILRRAAAAWATGREGMIPPPPPELQGADLRIEYVSEVAQLQRMAGLSGLERHVQFVAALAPIAPASVDVVDWDAVVRAHGDGMSIPAELNRDEGDTAAIREQRQQAGQMQAMAEAAPKLAQAAATATEPGSDGRSPIQRVMSGAA